MSQQDKIDPMAVTGEVDTQVLDKIKGAFDDAPQTNAGQVAAAHDELKRHLLAGIPAREEPQEPASEPMVDPLMEARRDGVDAVHEAITATGGLLTRDQFASLAHIPTGERLLTIEGKYPAFQAFGGRILGGLQQILHVLRTGRHDEIMMLAFFTGENARLGDQTPLAVLKTAHALAQTSNADVDDSDGVKRVLVAARNYTEQGGA